MTIMDNVFSDVTQTKRVEDTFEEPCWINVPVTICLITKRYIVLYCTVLYNSAGILYQLSRPQIVFPCKVNISSCLTKCSIFSRNIFWTFKSEYRLPNLFFSIMHWKHCTMVSVLIKVKLLFPKYKNENSYIIITRHILFTLEWYYDFSSSVFRCCWNK